MTTTMSAPTPALLSAFASELSGLSDAELQALINRAEFRVSEAYYGDQYNEAWTLAAAHLGAIALPTTTQATGGALKRKKVGDLEVEYDVSAAARIPAQYAGSRYGMELYYLMRSLAYKASPGVI
jgi:hypothetical protein